MLGINVVFRLLAALFSTFVLVSCSSEPINTQTADTLAQAGNYEQAIKLLQEQSRLDPQSGANKGALLRLTSLSLSELTRQADQARQRGDLENSKALYQRALNIDNNYIKAQEGLRLLGQSHRQLLLIKKAEAEVAKNNQSLASQYIRQVLTENPTHPNALKIQKQLREQIYVEERKPVLLIAGMDNSISLELRDTPLKDALLLLSSSAKLNFVLDQDIQNETKVTLFVTEARLEDVLEFVLQTYNLEKKVLNKNTLLIYPASPEKKSRYADLYTRSFQILNSPTAGVAELVRGILKPADLYIDEYSRNIIIRDTPEVLEAAERLIALNDVAPPEVMLDVEIIEVSTDILENLGVEYLDKVSLSVQGSDKKPGTLTWKELTDLNSDSFALGFGDPVAVLNIKNTLASGDILAKPQLRVKNLEKASVLIGDKVPVITTSLNQTSSFESQSVTYIDVGIKLDVQPQIFPSDEVSIAIKFEVSNIIKEIVGANGLRAYQIGTREANTTLQLKDGETQILAGLIKKEDIDSSSNVPGLSSIPWLGRIFSNKNINNKKSELVMLITPRIVRNTSRPDSFESEFYSGTKDRLSLKLPALGERARYAREPVKAAEFTPSSNGKAPPQATRNTITAAGALVDDVGSKFDLVAPHFVTSGQNFDVPIAFDSKSLKATNFSLSSSSKSLEIVSVTSMLAANELTHTIADGSATFRLNKSRIPRSGDILAVVRMRALPVGNTEDAVIELSADAATSNVGASQSIQILVNEQSEFGPSHAANSPAEITP